MTSRRMSSIVALALAAVVFGSYVIVFYPFTVDDTFITLRYARNLATGHGPTWNPGEDPPVEGYTSVLWVAVATIPHLLGLDAVAFVKLAGVLLACVTALCTFRLAKVLAHAAGRPTAFLEGAVAASMLLVLPETAVHAVSGMETSLCMALLTAFLLSIVEYVRQESGQGSEVRRFPCLPALLALLLVLTRPEMHLAAVSAFVVAYVVLPSGRARRRLCLTAVLLYAIPFLLYFSWRALYYGLLFPLPFYVKGLNVGPLAGWRSVAHFAVRWVCLPASFPIALSVLLHGRQLRMLWVPVLALAVFFIFPEHVMGYDFRFLHPVVPLLCVAAGGGFVVILSALSARGDRNVQLLRALQ